MSARIRTINFILVIILFGYFALRLRIHRVYTAVYNKPLKLKIREYDFWVFAEKSRENNANRHFVDFQDIQNFDQADFYIKLETG